MTSRIDLDAYFERIGYKGPHSLTIDNGRMLVSSTPQFLGSNPAEVPYGYGPGLRVLAAQEDAARTLVLALDAKRQAIAIVGPKPRGFASGTTVKFDPQTPGLPVSQMSSAHRDMLMKLIWSYAGIMPSDIATERMARIKAAGIDKIMFAWSGATAKGQPYQSQPPFFPVFRLSRFGPSAVPSRNNRTLTV
jgi:Protein of unknown function (DUF3500)